MSPAIATDPALPAAVARVLATPDEIRPDQPVVRIGPPAEDAEATWWWLDTVTDSTPLIPHSLEAIVVADEETRQQLEQRQPDAIGRVWVAPATPQQRNALLEQHYPVTNTSYRLGLVGYNLKFAKPIVTDLMRNPDVDAVVDEWRFFAAAPTQVTDRVLEDSDVVWCEWCGRNAVHASQHKSQNQRLIVRLHRFELETEHWKDINHEQVDTFVTVGDYYRDLALRRTGWPADKVVVIPNQVDDLQLARPKLPDARFTLGMLGASSSRKRLDLALDLIDRLHTVDSRFRLRIKTALPQDEKWVWDNAAERDFFTAQLPRLEQAPLADIATLDPFGADIAAWFRNIGFILSLSDDESFHLAPAEGMASGAVPVIRDWPGANTVYSPEWVHTDLDTMADRIVEIACDEGTWHATRRRAQEQALGSFAKRKVVKEWDHLLGTGSVDPLR